MYKASIILKNAREDKDLNLEEISKKLKISKKYLEAIETENRSAFPAEPYCSLIIKDYAVFLGLNGEDILSVFRRDFAQKTAPAAVSSDKLSLTPQFVFKIATIISLLFFLGYISLEYLKFNRPPTLKVTWPEDNSLALNTKIEITGTTDPEATVRINDDLIIIDQNGYFKKSINLQNPESKIVVESKSHNGKAALLEKTYHPK